jgi:hypothetical protein
MVSANHDAKSVRAQSLYLQSAAQPDYQINMSEKPLTSLDSTGSNQIVKPANKFEGLTVAANRD